MFCTHRGRFSLCLTPRTHTVLVFLETIFYALSATTHVFLQPMLHGSRLLALSHGSPQGRNHILKALAKYSTITPLQFKRTLSALLVAGELRIGNGFLSRLAANNWQATSPVRWNWSTEIAVITGGSGSIGRVIVEGLARRGITVVVSWSTTRVAHGTFDTSDEYLHKIFEINLFCYWSATREFLSNMSQRNKGHVVPIASMGSFVTVGTSVDYSATKAGVLAFHEGLGNELRYIYKAPGVLSTVVHPNYVQTPMTGMHEYRFVRQGTMLRAEDVGNRVVSQILARQGGQLILPEHLALTTPALRGWPTWMQDGLRDIISKPVIAGLVS
ncbi:hypothetical protein BJY01DRAFT_241739 [Aspergillus pseudoustus]|uniref:Uncharacterized protein n=1 Tax=Aspergillus pseudoustus TaxID=1810923 RepID=A0ABR4I872_9EURO